MEGKDHETSAGWCGLGYLAQGHVGCGIYLVQSAFELPALVDCEPRAVDLPQVP